MGTIDDISSEGSDMDIDYDVDLSPESRYGSSPEYDSMESDDGFVVHSANISPVSGSDSDYDVTPSPTIEIRNPGYRLRTRRMGIEDDAYVVEVGQQAPQLTEQPEEINMGRPPSPLPVDLELPPVVIVEALNADPVITVPASKSNDDPDNYSELCSICLDSWTNSGVHRIAALQCGHVYGRGCIEKWLKGDGKRCPQCNSKAKKSDIRNLCVTSIRVLDTAERDRTIQELENERQLRRRAELETAKLRLKLDLAEEEIAKLKKDRYGACGNDHSRVISNWDAYQLQREGSSKSVELNLPFCKYVEVSKEEGACRVITCSESIGMMVASVHGTTTIMPGYGVKKYYMVDYQSPQYMHIHSQQIRDLAFHPTRIDGLLLSASLDKSIKITNVLTNNIVQSYPLDAAVWSCTWNHDNDYQMFAGCGNGSTFLFDIRQTTSYVQKLTSDKKTPVTSLQYINQDISNAFGGGVIAGHLNGSVLHEGCPSDQYKPAVLPLDGNVSSLSFEPSSRLLLASMRPSENHRNARHIVCELVKEIGDARCTENTYKCNVIQTFLGGVSQQLLMRSRIFSHPNNKKSALVCAGDESSMAVMVWDVGTATCVSRLASKSAVVDICPMNKDTFTLATLAGRFINLYSTKPWR